MRRIYTGTFDCPICGGKQEVHLYGTESIEIDDDLKRDTVEHGRWNHWCQHHRNCAVCGKFTSSDELELAVNDGNIKIHSVYNDYYREVELGDIRGPFLDVHRQCVSGDKE